MACKNHIKTQSICNLCLKELVEDQGKIVYNLMERWEFLAQMFPHLQGTFQKIEKMFPLTIKEKV